MAMAKTASGGFLQLVEWLGAFRQSGNLFQRPPFKKQRRLIMLEWILIALVVAAIASLLGFHGVAGVAGNVAKILIGIVLVLFLLVLFGVIAIA
jgi:uncharacterized membrane protein YtjA (UPF0391 family)